MENAHIYRSLRRNMMITVIVVSLTPLVLIGAVTSHHYTAFYHEKVAAHLGELVLKHKQAIDGFLAERLAGLRFLARSETFGNLRNEAFLKDRLGLLQEEFGRVFVDLGVVLPSGVQVAYAGPFRLEGADYSAAAWFGEALRREDYISDVFLGMRGLPHFIVAVRREDGGSEYLLRATIDFVAFNSLVEKTQMGRTGRAFILNRKGEFQTTPPGEVAADRAFYVETLLPRLVPEGVSLLERRDPKTDREWLYVAAPLKSGDWVLVYRQEAAEVFAELDRVGRIALAVFILGGLAIAVMAYFLSRRMVGRVVRADREKEMMNEQVIETGKLASLGELAAGVAHEINNPVAIMVEEAGWIEDLLEEEDLKGAKDAAELRRAVGQIRTQGERCKEITHKLLSFARKTDSRVRHVHLGDLVKEVVDLSERRARYENVKVTLDLDPALPPVEASPTEMQQVFLNLVNNALDAMDGHGGAISISARREGATVLIEVADTGPGIPKAVLGRIFDPFFTTKPVGKGTGLGLSICYGIVNKMGGEITVRSQVGAGTTFIVRLPLSAPVGGDA